MHRRMTTRAGVAALLVGVTLTACSAGSDAGDPDRAPDPEPARDRIETAEPTWTREVREADGPLGWSVHGDRAYRIVWPGAPTDSDAELVALDLVTGEDLWSVEHPGVIGNLLADESGGVLVVDASVDATLVTAYDERGALRWTATLEAVPDDISAGVLHDPVGAFDVENDLVMIGSRSVPGIIGLDLSDGSLRWHLRHEDESGRPLYAGTQLERFGDTLAAVDDFNAPSIAALQLDADGGVPTVTWHHGPSTRFGDGIIADERGFVAVTARSVLTWDLADGELIGSEAIPWQRDEPGFGGLEGRAFAGVYLFEDTIVIERDRRWVLDRADLAVRTSYDLDGDDAAPLVKPLGRGIGPRESDPAGGLVTVGEEGLIARIDAQGSVTALRSVAAPSVSIFVPVLLVGESSVAVGVRRGDEPVWDLWAVDLARLTEAG